MIPRRLHVVTFGCQMSAADGGELSRPLLARGLAAVDSPDEADAIILNTCTVRQHAEDRAVSYIGRLREWKDARPHAFLIVAGCAAQRLGPWIQERFPYVDLVVGAKSIEQYPEILEEALRKRYDWGAENETAWPPDGPGAPRGGASAYLTVMRGCNYACTYCIVPAVRGRELYRPFETILAEARRMAAAGAKEIMLLGQTVNSYRDGGLDFADLLRAAAAVPGVERLRFMSPHPHYLTPRMISAMAETPQICPHMHLPAQSGSDRVLRRMRRNYTAAEFLAKAEALRRAIGGITLTTDAIVGFPGETEGDFQDTLALLRALDPISAYCFAFSPRQGTEAAAYGDAVPDDVRQDRLRRLLALVEGRQREHLAAQVGRRARVLLEDERVGRTERFFRARLETAGRPGDIVEVAVTGSTSTGLSVRRQTPAPALF